MNSSVWPFAIISGILRHSVISALAFLKGGEKVSTPFAKLHTTFCVLLFFFLLSLSLHICTYITSHYIPRRSSGLGERKDYDRKGGHGRKGGRKRGGLLSFYIYTFFSIPVDGFWDLSFARI